jgi:hypothetical protein
VKYCSNSESYIISLKSIILIILLLLCSGGVFFPFAVFSNAGEKISFDANNAWRYLLKQCNFGPRNPGSSGHHACRDYLAEELKKFTSRVQRQSFTHTDSRLQTTFYLDNIIADFGPEGAPKMILCAHWDTRPRADRDPITKNRSQPIIGANDGASGVAVLLELARIFADHPPSLPVQMVFFDGEDYGREGEDWDYLLGSKFFAENLNPRDYRFAILLDMIGDEDLEIKREYNSYKFSRNLQDRIWNLAYKMGVSQFSERMTLPITDDHLSLIEIGIPAVDIIDFEYGQWHTLDDTPEYCSKASLEAVGKVLLELIHSER